MERFHARTPGIHVCGLSTLYSFPKGGHERFGIGSALAVIARLALPDFIYLFSGLVWPRPSILHGLRVSVRRRRLALRRSFPPCFSGPVVTLALPPVLCTWSRLSSALSVGLFLYVHGSSFNDDPPAVSLVLSLIHI